MSELEQAFHARLADREPHIPRKASLHAFASEALGCTRQIALRMLKPTDDRNRALSTLIAFKIGETIHATLQDIIVNLWGGAVEVEWDLGAISGRADGVYQKDGKTIIVEIKTMADYAFGYAFKSGKPKPEHFMQGNLGALALGGDAVHVIYVNKGAKSGQAACADWLLEADTASAAVELDRLAWVAEKANAGIVPPALFAGDEIVDPKGKKWPCAYCPVFEMCRYLGPGEHQLMAPERVVEMVAERLAGIQAMRQAQPCEPCQGAGVVPEARYLGSPERPCDRCRPADYDAYLRETGGLPGPR